MSQPASLRKVSLVVSLLLGALGIALLTGPLGRGLVQPGELSEHHAVIGENCAKCHVHTEEKVKELHAGLAASEVEMIETGKCLACHDWGEAARNPHALSPEELARLTEEARAHLGDAAPGGRLSPPMNAAGQVACATCHREHQGRDFALTALDNNQCQSCHVATFERFGSGHPELGDFGYERRTRIVFTHREHEFKHFPKEMQEYRCNSCHVPDARQERLLLQSYESMCASCHDPALMGEGSTQLGMAFLRLPGVDVASLRRAGEKVGPWPADADEGFDAMASVFLDLLVAADPDYAEAADDLALLSSLDLTDLMDATAEESAAAARYVRAARGLVEALGTHGQGALLMRLERAFDSRKARLALYGVADQVSDAALAGAAAEWFGAKRAGEREKWGTSGGWLVDSRTLALRYLPEGHADGFLRAWHDLAAVSGDEKLLKYFMKSEDRCTTCHSVDLSADSGQVNWHGDPGSVRREFTRFSHKPHLKVIEKCVDCHALSPGAAYLAGFEGNFDPAQFVSEYKPFVRKDCAQCHSAAGAGDECLKCHLYHVGEFDPALLGR